MSPRTLTLAAVAAAGALLTACTSSAATDSHTPPSTPRTSRAVAVVPAGVGTTLTLHGTGSSQQLAVRLDKVLPTAHGGPQDQPAAGHRYFAAELTITNTGTARLDEGPWISTTVTDAQNHQYDTAAVMATTAGPELPGDVKTLHGAARTGWILFEVPTAARITGLEYGAAGGLGDTADWRF